MKNETTPKFDEHEIRSTGGREMKTEQDVELKAAADGLANAIINVPFFFNGREPKRAIIRIMNEWYVKLGNPSLHVYFDLMSKREQGYDKWSVAKDLKAFTEKSKFNHTRPPDGGTI